VQVCLPRHPVHQHAGGQHLQLQSRRGNKVTRFNDRSCFPMPPRGSFCAKFFEKVWPRMYAVECRAVHVFIFMSFLFPLCCYLPAFADKISRDVRNPKREVRFGLRHLRPHKTCFRNTSHRHSHWRSSLFVLKQQYLIITTDWRETSRTRCVTVGRVSTARLLGMCGNHG
jgi:hypothetical protein